MTRRCLTAVLAVTAVALALPSLAAAVPSMTFGQPSVQGNGNVRLEATINSSTGDCPNGCSALLTLEAPSGNLLQPGSSLLYWSDSDPSYDVFNVLPLSGMAAGTYTAFGSVVDGGGTTRPFTGPSFAFPTTSLRLSAVRVKREGTALTLSYRVRDGGTLVGAAQQAKSRTVLTLTRLGKPRPGSPKRLKARVRSQSGRNRHLIPYRVSRRIEAGARYRVDLVIRDRLKRRHLSTGRVRF